ncbi:MAG: rhomboid family intramembrane serine protease, partial [Gammaproteobacteria bacterium]|nr:rhomboid family intramembrane serine protease [Gammaproteobacteria bacterium]
MILPFSAELSLARLPWITFAVMLLCLLLFLAQVRSREMTLDAATDYCHKALAYDGGERQDDPVLNPVDECASEIAQIHARPSPEVDIERWYYAKALTAMRWHYQQFLQHYPPNSVDAELLYVPQWWWSLQRIIGSSLAHADTSHILFNLLFFFAFSPAVEILVGSRWRYIAILTFTAVASAWSYSLWAMLNQLFMPTLGLSGVVMGVIGLSAFMMPKARIRTFLFLPPRIIYIPSLYLAIFYIGSDLFDLIGDGMSGGVNLVAHVFGGLSGYLSGWLWLRQRKTEIADELADEIEISAVHREDRQGVHKVHPRAQQRLVT